MRVEIAVDPTRLLRWHLWLFERLAAARAEVIPCVRWTRSREAARPVAVELLLRLESLTGRMPPACALEPVSPDAPAIVALLRSGTAGPPDLVIDLAGAGAGTPNTACWSLRFDGAPGEIGLWQALLACRAPLVSIHLGDGSRLLPGAAPATEAPRVLAASATMVLARAADALAAAVGDRAAGREPHPRGRPSAAMPAPSLATASTVPTSAGTAFAAQVVAGMARSRLERLLGSAPRWAVALRDAPAGRTHPPATLDPARYRLLADDGRRYYADPFLFAHQDTLHLFVEEYPNATGRGLVSHTTLDRDGRPGTPRPVLERPYHLSYPQVFAHRGAIWMIPESAASGAVELYRADPFPDRWTLVARLVEDHLHDATLFAHEGRLWIAAASQSAGSSSWDALSLFHAEHLTGPWRPHVLNPVRLDAAASRPAGQLYRQAGALWRPAQDCSRMYGGALALARIDRLDPDHHSETVVATLDLADMTGAAAAGPHTLNWAGTGDRGVEAIDLMAPTGWQPRREPGR